VFSQFHDAVDSLVKSAHASTNIPPLPFDFTIRAVPQLRPPEVRTSSVLARDYKSRAMATHIKPTTPTVAANIQAMLGTT
jgi:hypothetical protein